MFFFFFHFLRGQQYYKKNLTGFGISNLAGAVVSTVDPNTKQVNESIILIINFYN